MMAMVSSNYRFGFLCAPLRGLLCCLIFLQTMLGTSFPCEIEPNEDSNDLGNALSSIALELQRLYKPQETDIVITTREVKSDDNFNNMLVYKSKLLTKNRQIKRLRKNMKTAYVVARAVISAKEDETKYLSNHIQQSRDQCESLLRNSKLSSKMIEDLKSEGQNLRGEKEAIEIYISLGYEQLQKMRNLPLKNISVTDMLKEIMISCGEYYSNYENERLKTLHLEHKNRFLNTYVNVLKNDIKALSEDVVAIRAQNIRLQSENQTLNKTRNSSKDEQDVDYRRSFNTFDNKKSTSSSEEQNCKKNPANFNSHLETIKRLLKDQDNMLKSLKKISEELTIHEDDCF